MFLLHIVQEKKNCWGGEKRKNRVRKMALVPPLP